MAKILVTGGCGYIGSHTIVDLITEGYEPISVDNLLNADESVLQGIKAITGKSVLNYRADLCNEQELRKVFAAHPDIKGIIHFAALKAVNESVNEPLRYYSNNLTGLINLLNVAFEYSVRHFIFSSSCSVYGESDILPVTEMTPVQEAKSPYAYTKQAGERIINDLAFANPDFKSILLRYFNPAGAHPSALIGESSRNIASNLVPVITESAIGKRDRITVFGTDYDTRDGSCIRDYIHVMDIAHAHTLALRHILTTDTIQRQAEIFNLGSGTGTTVTEAIRAFEKVSGCKLNVIYGPRREGDVAAVYADNTKAKKILGWKLKYDIDEIMRTAWLWEQKRP